MIDWTRPNFRATNNIRNFGIYIKSKRFAFDQTELSEMVAVIRGVENVRVVQLSHRFQFLVKLEW